jgi:Mn-dependent DtxR family transcriptional regulator
MPDTMYLSSGIRKKDKRKILSQIHEKEKANAQYILVSTQVVEAGVDISFSHIFREKAPLDSIIQVMGRLNREAEADEARLAVFEYDNEFRPYSQLELDESEKILKEAKDSTQLYSSLAQYYKSISEKNETYKKYSSELEYYISRLDFDRIWEFINYHVLDKALENERDTVLIPDLHEWDEIKQIIMRSKLTKTNYRRFADISASLPKKIYDLGIEDYFDSEALEKNILLPKKEYLNEVYHDVVGTDKWLLDQN